MNTLDLQRLVLGDRNQFVFIPEKAQTEVVNPKKVTNFLVKLHALGYGFSNADVLFTFSKVEFKSFKNELQAVLEANTKQGMIFRQTFAESEELTEYTNQDWIAILAQYAITYDWQSKYVDFFGVGATQVLSDYVDKIPKEVATLFAKNKVISIGNRQDLINLIKSIVESKVVLRSQQIQTLEACPKDALASACKNADITIKETLVKVMSLLQGYKLDFPLLKTATDVMRFVVATQTHTPLEGQISKTDLKQVKLRIPTSVRKTLLNNLQQIANKRGAKFLTEDMFSYDMFWKRLDKYLRFEKAVKTRKKYPLYTQAIDLLYEDDRSWTFNGRYSAAKAELDYDAAIHIAAERPGFLLRNLQEFLRMVKGTKLPTKASNVNLNAFQNALSGLAPENDVVYEDASNYLLSEEFGALLNKNLNTKLAWQLIENLKDESIFESVMERTVQGVTVQYTTPFPGLNKSLTKKVRKQILKALKLKLQERNKDYVVYLDDDSSKYRLQYSGRSSTEISFAGEFLAPGSELFIGDLFNGKEDAILRLGVLWRGLRDGQSVDIDHSLSVVGGQPVYYGNPTLQNRQGETVVTSSGDITSCGGQNAKFSTELVDIDLTAMSKTGYKEMFNSFIDYGNRTNIGELETYIFFSVIDKNDRVIKGNNISVDLAKQDYAIRIDPTNAHKCKSYLGAYINLEKGKIKVLAKPVPNAGSGLQNVNTNSETFQEALQGFDNQLTIKYALKKAVTMTDNIEEANIVISRKDLTLTGNIALLHPGRNMEEINELLF